MGIKGCMPVILGANDGQLMLIGAETVHVPAGAHGIGVHENASAFSGWCLSRGDGNLYLFADLFKHLQLICKIIHVHTGGVGTQRQGLVGMGDLFRTQRQGDVIHTGADSRVGHMERRGAAGAGIFHICYGNTANAVTP